jgi:cytochrome c551/c552
MDFLGQHVIAPTGQHLRLLEFLAVVIYTMHLPYIALVVGSTAVAMWLTFSDHELPNPRFARLAEDLIRTFLGGKLPMLVLGVLPLLALPFIYTQWFVGLPLAPIKYIVLPIPGIVLGLSLLALYRGSFAHRRTSFNLHMGLGTIGLAVLLGSYFVLMSSVARLQDPEKWFRLTNLAILVLNWNVIWKFLFFVHLALAMTGAGILFFLFRWPGPRAVAELEYVTFARRFGAGLGLAFSFALPVFNLFYVFTSADVVFDSTTYVLATAITFVCMLIAYAFIGALRAPAPRYAATTFTLFMIVFALASSFDLRAMANANREHARLIELAEARGRLQREAQLEAAVTTAGAPVTGRDIFTRMCMQCHRMNERLVGPSFAERLPRYAGNLDALKGFIAHPVQVTEEYSPMPHPPLSPAQVDSVATYLLHEFEALQAGGRTAPAPPPTPTPSEVKSDQPNH